MKKSMSVSEFKSKSLGVFEQIAKTGETITITKRGKPIAKVIPFSDASEKPVPGKLAGTVIHIGDIVTPFGAKIWKAAEPAE